LQTQCHCGVQLPIKNVFCRRIRQNLPMLRGILSASTEVVHRPRSDPPLHFDIRNIWQIRTQNIKFQRSRFASRRHARALAAGLLHQDHVYMTIDESFCFHINEFDEMLCKMDSTENPCSFEKYPNHLNILILRTHTKFIRKNKVLALGVCFPQPCWSVGHRFAALTLPDDHVPNKSDNSTGVDFSCVWGVD